MIFFDKDQPPETQTQLLRVKDLLVELCEWEAIMGGFENPIWRRARGLRDHLPDLQDEWLVAPPTSKPAMARRALSPESRRDGPADTVH